MLFYLLSGSVLAILVPGPLVLVSAQLLRETHLPFATDRSITRPVQVPPAVVSVIRGVERPQSDTDPPCVSGYSAAGCIATGAAEERCLPRRSTPPGQLLAVPSPDLAHR